MSKILIVLVLLLSVLFVGAIAFQLDHGNRKDGCTAKLKFKQFLSLYSVAPEKWTLNMSTVRYRQDPTETFEYTDYYFSVLDTIRYDIFVETMNKNNTDAQNRKDLEKAIQCWNRDIREYCKKNNVPIREDDHGTEIR